MNNTDNSFLVDQSINRNKEASKEASKEARGNMKPRGTLQNLYTTQNSLGITV